MDIESVSDLFKINRLKKAKSWKNLYKAEIWYSGLVKCPEQHTKSPSESGAGVVPQGAKTESQNSFSLITYWILSLEKNVWRQSDLEYKNTQKRFLQIFA
jgi:hypothetical protein